MSYNCGRPEGQAHRARILAMVLPGLRVGGVVPSTVRLSYWLRISKSEAARHRKRALDEAGVVTEVRGRGKGRRLYVVSMPPAWRAAA
jgi:hypothetical protein